MKVVLCSIGLSDDGYAQKLAPSPTLSKLAPALSAPTARRTHPSLRVSVREKAAFEQWLQQHMPGARTVEASGDGRILSISGVSALRLAECPFVIFVDVPNRTAREEGPGAISRLTNKVSAAHGYFPAISGEGLVGSVKEKAFDPDHIDFKGRVRASDLFNESFTAHATTMASLMAGAGNSNPAERGVAWQAQLATSSYAQLLPDDGSLLKQTGVSVQNHSYGVDVENYYGLEAQAYDGQCVQYPSLMHVFSSGNLGRRAGETGVYAGLAGFANLTGQFKLSKNTLSVGAVDAREQPDPRSSRGPAHDGRVKPELVAYGDGGTSESAAIVSGICLLMQGAYQARHNGSLPPSSLVKAALLNSADDVGRPAVDFETGFGNADALGAVKTIVEGRFFTATIAAKEDKVFTIPVPEGTQQLKVTLTWTDPPAAANAAQTLVNDLDLEVIHVVSRTRWHPWVLSTFPHPDSLVLPARRGIDHLNNVEQVTIALPPSGQYELRVRGANLIAGAQDFSLAYEAEKGFIWLYPTQGDGLESSKAQTIRWEWNGTTFGSDAQASLQFKPVGSATWQVVSNAVPLSQGSFFWTPPDTMTLNQLRLVIGNEVFISDTFVVSPWIEPVVGFNCKEEAMISWSPLSGNPTYQVFRLGGTQIEPWFRTVDTVLVLDRQQKQQARYYAVAPMVGTATGGRGATIDYTHRGSDCYVYSFLPRQLVSDSLLLDLELNSSYRLKSVILERNGPGGFQPLQSVAPVSRLQIAFRDLQPQLGPNLYRIRLESDAGQIFYSQTETAFYLGKTALLLFPNPVPAGQPLSILETTQSPSTVRLYDSLGRLLQETNDAGVIKVLDTKMLRPGAYLIRLRTEQGTELTGCMVVF